MFTDLDLGAIFATHASLGCSTPPTKPRPNLQLALDSNRQIGIAIGLLTASCTSDQAFDQLRAASQPLDGSPLRGRGDPDCAVQPGAAQPVGVRVAQPGEGQLAAEWQ